MGPTDKWYWQRMVPDFVSLSGIDFSSAVLKNRFDNLKQNWQLWNKLKSKEIGLGWNSMRGTIDAFDEWWTARIEENPQYKKFRRAPLKFVEKLDLLFNSRVAIGENRFTTGMSDLHIGDSMNEDSYTPFFGDDYTHQPVTPPFVSPIDLDRIGEDQSTRTFPVKATPSMNASGSSGKRSRIESTSRSRKKKALEVRAETNSKFDKCIEVMQSHFEKKQSASVDQTYDDAMTALLALNLGDENDALLYFGIQLFESEAQRCLFVRTPEHKHLGYLRAIYAMRMGGGAT